jgi:hypothetical protein
MSGSGMVMGMLLSFSRGRSPDVAVRPEGANHQWRRIPPREKLWGVRRRSWHLHRPYELMEVTPWPKSMISAEA